MSKGYIYTMFAGADPGAGWAMTDPIFGKKPTLGACMPNVRRLVVPGDHIFVVSGRVPNASQYIVGGFRVAEKIDALAAYHRFPENRMKVGLAGTTTGNIIVLPDGTQNPADYHTGFAERVKNYVVGEDQVQITKARAVEQARLETVKVLSEIFGRKGSSVKEVIGRWRKLDGAQIRDLREWIVATERGR